LASLGVSDEWIDKLATVKSPIAFSLMPKPPHPCMWPGHKTT